MLQQKIRPPFSVDGSTQNSVPPSLEVVEYNYYKIEYRRASESSRILFAKQEGHDQQRVVIKVLCQYQDTRYQLSTLAERQQCQLEALRWNCQFTPGVYRGLGPILAENDDTICIGKIDDDPDRIEEHLDEQKDYALVMDLLQDDRRVDRLLREEKSSSLRALLRLLVKRIADMHKHLAVASGSDEEGLEWGSFEQLRKKLDHNIGLLKLVTTVKGSHHYRDYYWMKSALLQMIDRLQDPNDQASNYIEHRLQGRWIKRCHGDLKAENIWINLRDYREETWQRAKILDAIDFNPAYSNIDVLSDIAMLVVDIHAIMLGDAATESRAYSQAHEIIREYLRLTSQWNDKIAKVMLTYYLVEKALVRAAVSIAYDDVPALGERFFQVAAIYMEELDRLLGTSIATRCQRRKYATRFEYYHDKVRCHVQRLRHMFS